MNRIRAVLAVALLTIPGMSAAEVYQWMDEGGAFHFVDDLGKVPVKYRKSAVRTDLQEPAVEVIEKGDADKAPARRAEPKGGAPAADEKGKGKPAQLFDGKDGETWKRDFSRVKNDIRAFEEHSASIRSRMANPGSMSRGEYLTLQNTLRDLDVRLTTARTKLQELTDAADRASVPPEYR